MKKTEDEVGLEGEEEMSVNIDEGNFTRKTYKGAIAGEGGVFFFFFSCCFAFLSVSLPLREWRFSSIKR